MRLLPAILIAIAIILAPVLWYVIPMLLPAEKSFVDAEGPSVDSQARIEIVMLQDIIAGLQEGIQQQSEALRVLQSELSRMDGRLSNLESAVRSGAGAGMGASRPSAGADGFIEEGSMNSGAGIEGFEDFYTQVVLIADRRNVNKGLTIANPKFLLGFLGSPRESLSDDCQPMTNQKLKSMLVTERVGPIRVTMLQPAVESLKVVFENIRRADPQLFDRINTAGSLCVRRIRGSRNSVSTHSFGLSLDLNIDGRLDTFADGKTQMGLMILKDFFKEEGWFWGAGFGREDSMHFEVSRGKLEEWRAQGKI